MKKKIGLFIAVGIVAVCIAVLAFLLSDKNSTQTPVEPDDGVVMLIDFEDIKQTLRTVRLRGYNKAEFTEDSAYVTQGNKALHICPVADGEAPQDYSQSMLVLYPDKKRFDDVEYVCIDVYNPSEKEVPAAFGFTDILQQYTLKPGNNSLWLYIDRTRLSYANKSEISDFYLQVGYGSTELPNVYVDNFRCYTTTEPAAVYVRDNSGNTKFSFASEAELADINYIYWLGANLLKPVFSINRDAAYIKSGTGSLKVEFKPDGESMFAFKDGSLGSFEAYIHDETMAMVIPVYNANNFDVGVTMIVHSALDGGEMILTKTIAPGSWYDFEFPIHELCDRFTGNGLDIEKLEIYADSMEQGGTLYVDSIEVKTIQQED